MDRFGIAEYPLDPGTFRVVDRETGRTADGADELPRSAAEAVHREREGVEGC